MFISALFIIAQNWKQSKCSSSGGWINSMWYIHKMKHHPSTSLEESSSIMLSERSQSQKVTYHTITRWWIVEFPWFSSSPRKEFSWDTQKRVKGFFVCVFSKAKKEEWANSGGWVTTFWVLLCDFWRGGYLIPPFRFVILTPSSGSTLVSPLQPLCTNLCVIFP